MVSAVYINVMRLRRPTSGKYTSCVFKDDVFSELDMPCILSVKSHTCMALWFYNRISD